MEEIFEIVKAVNRLKEMIIELIGKIDLVLKSPVAGQPCRDARPCVSDRDAINRVSTADGYVEEGACRILHISPRTLAYLRADGSIPYIKKGKRIQYLASDLCSYMEQIKIRDRL